MSDPKSNESLAQGDLEAVRKLKTDTEPTALVVDELYTVVRKVKSVDVARFRAYLVDLRLAALDSLAIKREVDSIGRR